MKKKLISVILVLSLLSPLELVSVFANNEPPEPTPPPSISTYAHVIVTQYQYIYGVLCYRRWNQTKGTWVDPYWTQVPR